MNLLEVKNLRAKIGNKEILKGLDLSIKPGETHIIMGPNGSGKSSLSKVLAGHPQFDEVSGEVLFESSFAMKNLFDWEAHERAHQGLFIAYQYPIEIPGISNRSFLEETLKAQCLAQGVDAPVGDEFDALIRNLSKHVGLTDDFLDRGLNQGFSGGEKKRNEMLQLLLLKPRLAILDETDSGLDVDAIKLISQAIQTYKTENPESSLIIITHYTKLIELVKPDQIHILANGKIEKSGGYEIADMIEKKGFNYSEVGK